MSFFRVINHNDNLMKYRILTKPLCELNNKLAHRERSVDATEEFKSDPEMARFLASMIQRYASIKDIMSKSQGLIPQEQLLKDLYIQAENEGHEVLKMLREVITPIIFVTCDSPDARRAALERIGHTPEAIDKMPLSQHESSHEVQTCLECLSQVGVSTSMLAAASC